jgi:hypothetical protein
MTSSDAAPAEPVSIPGVGEDTGRRWGLFGCLEQAARIISDPPRRPAARLRGRCGGASQRRPGPDTARQQDTSPGLACLNHTPQQPVGTSG